MTLPGPAPEKTSDPRIRLGAAEWVVGLALLFGSLPGPWLTLAFPAAAAFALHDRRRAARWVGGGIALLAAVATLGSAAGPIFLGAAVLAVAGTGATVGRSGLALDAIALPALAGAAVAIGLGVAIAPGAVAGWENALRGAIDEGTAMAIESYRALGVDPRTLEAVRTASEATAGAVIAVWPALVALALWLGCWLGWRFLGRWGRIADPLAGRLVDPGFGAFRLGDAWLWIGIAALAALWAPGARRVAVNAALVAGTLHALQGFAVVDRGLERRGWGALARTLVPGAAVALVTPLALGGALVIGLADHWLDLRERGADNRSNGYGG